jgi:hypothetical protein
MAVSSGIWVERIIIVAIIAVLAFFAGGFAATLRAKKGESAADRDARSEQYKRAGIAGGVTLGVLWMLIMAGMDHRQSERRELLSRRARLEQPARGAISAEQALRDLRKASAE